jgi:ligand-binding sensor domain-containing protein
MKKPKLKRFSLINASLLLILVSLTTCVKTEDDLLDPESSDLWTLYNKSDGLPDNFIWKVTADAQNDIWIAGYGVGAARYHDDYWQTYNTSNSGILSDWVTAFETTPNGGIWIGTESGLCKLTENGEWKYYLINNGPILNISTLKRASDGTLWIGTFDNYIWSLYGSQYSQYIIGGQENVNAIEEDTQGNLWFGTDSGLLRFNGVGWRLFTTNDGLPKKEVSALCYDSQDRLWIGTSGGLTVSYMDISHEIHQLSLMIGAFGTFIRDIHEDRKGDIWFATWLNGLVRYDGVIPHVYEDYNYKSYNIESKVNCIGEDQLGNLWFGMYTKGLVKHTLSLD